MSLIEVPLGIFIIGVVLLLYNGAANSLMLNRTSKYQETAVRIGVSAMEDLRSTAFDSLPASGPLSHPLLSELPSGSINLTASDFSDFTKQMTVTITWQEPGGKNRSVTFSTYINETGI